MTITVLFYFFALILLISGLRVVTASNPVQAVLFLTLAFFNAAAIWMLLQAEFLAILLVLVYVGAVMVLFLFVVMMLDIKHIVRQDLKRFSLLAASVGALMIIETGSMLWRGFSTTFAPLADSAGSAGKAINANHSNAYALGKLIYTKYIFAFEIAGFILLVAIISAIALALHGNKNRKNIDVAQQIRVRREDRIRIVKC